jgi:GntR family transcriptional regulator
MREDLVRRIYEGEYTPGEQLPSEPDLARVYEVSRMTVREALKSLQQESLLYVVPGSGTFVARAPIIRAVTRLQSVTELAAGLGYTMVTRVLSARADGASSTIAAALGIEIGDPVLFLERLRLIDDQPAIHSLDTLPARLVEMDRPAEAWQGSLFAYIDARNDLHITHSTATLRPVLLDAPTRARIGAPPDIPWQLIEQTSYAGDRHPVIHSLDYHRGDLFSFDMVRRRY